MTRSGGTASPLRFQGMKETEMKLPFYGDLLGAQTMSTEFTAAVNTEAQLQQLENDRTAVAMKAMQYATATVISSLKDPAHNT